MRLALVQMPNYGSNINEGDKVCLDVNNKLEKVE